MRRALLCAGLAAVCAACTVFSPPPEYDYFVLSSAAGRTAEAPERKPGTAEGPDEAQDDRSVLVISDVTLPAYLERDEMAVRLGPNQLAYRDQYRWAEPLDIGIERVLREDLDRRLAPVGIVVQRRRAGGSPDYAVRLQLLRFEPVGDERVELLGRWAIRRRGRALRTGESRIAEPMAGPGGAEAAAAASRAVQRLGAEIAAEARDLERAAEDAESDAESDTESVRP